MKRVFAVLAAAFALTVLTAQAADSTKIDGWISDSACAQKHAGSPNVACVKKCIEGGSKPVFVDEAKREVWSIDNPDTVKAFYGDYVAVTALVDPTSKSVHIAKVAALK
jgi:hypothetical protein